MSLLRDGVAVRGDQPRFASDQQLMQCAERRQRDLRGTDLEPRAIDYIELPCRQNRHDARRQLHVHELTRSAPLDLNATRALPIKRMPAIVDDDILPDMGRMSARLRSGAKIISSPAPTVAASSGQSLPRSSKLAK